VKDFLRSGSGGDILIPCESGGRAIELIQLLIRNVIRDKGRLETDMLVYLSPMSNNTLDFARAQLEWMSDTLCRDFYMGGQNPFDFSVDMLKCVSSV
jgi:cleavage and polyadenylation specificity factor subunit 2